MQGLWCEVAPWMRAILHSFLTVFAPLEAIVHDVHVCACFDGISRLARPLRVLLLPRSVACPVPSVEFSKVTQDQIPLNEVNVVR